MSITTPFNPETFADEMKPKISGADLVLQYDNIESSIDKVAIDCINILGEVLYENICKDTASDNSDLQSKAKDYLQRSMLHFCMYEHLIFLITRIKNSGVTVAKTEGETTVYKYQQLELQDKFITLGWFWMNLLIQLLNKYPDEFPDWKDSDAQKSLSDIPIDMSDFDKWVSVKDEYFMIVARSIIREVWTDCVKSRIAEPQKTDRIARAVCYEVMARACLRLSYFCLPEPIRRDISSEIGKNHASQEDQTIRDKVSKIFESKAASYWTGLDLELKKMAVKEQSKSISDAPTFKPPRISEDDSFVY